VNLLNHLDSGVAIADGNNLTYINKQAWKFLRCFSAEATREIEKVHCLSSDSSEVVSPLEQLSSHIRKSDPEFANIETKDMIKTLSDKASQNGLLLNLKGTFSCENKEVVPEQDPTRQ